MPDEMVTQFGAIGTAEMVRERFELYKSVGINGLTLRLEAKGRAGRMALLEQVMDLL